MLNAAASDNGCTDVEDEGSCPKQRLAKRSDVSPIDPWLGQGQEDPQDMLSEKIYEALDTASNEWKVKVSQSGLCGRTTLILKLWCCIDVRLNGE